MSTDVTHKDRYVDAGGFRTRYWSAGEGGRPLIFLHGLGGTIEDWAGTLGPLSAQRRVIAIDLLGSGRTDKPDDISYQIHVMRDHIRSTLDALSLNTVDLNGWSLGGRIALALAHQDPDRFRRLVLTAPAGIGPDTIFNFEAPMHKLIKQILMHPAQAGVRILGNAMDSDSAARLAKFTARRVTLASDPASRNAFLRQLQSIVGPAGYLSGPRNELLSQLPDIKVPTLAIWGREDHFVPFAHAAILSQLMPDCTMRVIDRCGHTSHIEWPEVYNQTLTDLLNAP